MGINHIRRPGAEDPVMGLDGKSYADMAGTARWARIYAVLIVAVACFFMLAALWMFAIAAGILVMQDPVYDVQFQAAGGAVYSGVIGCVCLVISGVILFPALYLLKFSARLRTAVRTGETMALTNSTRSLRNYFRYVGVLYMILAFLAIVGILVQFVAVMMVVR